MTQKELETLTRLVGTLKAEVRWVRAHDLTLETQANYLRAAIGDAVATLSNLLDEDGDDWYTGSEAEAMDAQEAHDDDRAAQYAGVL